MRNRFGEQLERLHVEMIQMGALCEDAISAAAQALMKGDEDLARAAGEAEREIDQKEREVENLCLKLLLQQQPVARDLREISSALKMISDLERIGDQAADIAELTRFVRLPDGPGRQRIEEMSKAVIRMVTDSVDSFVKRDLELAREVCREDDQVDDLFNQVKKELIGLIAAEFPTTKTRSIFGHSMGGHGALTLALRHPQLFRSVSAFAPISSPTRCPWGEKAFSAYLGEDRTEWARHDAALLIEGGAAAGAFDDILVDQGDADSFLTDQLKPELLVAAAEKAGQGLTLRMQPGYDHSYFFMASFVDDHVAFHATRLKA